MPYLILSIGISVLLGFLSLLFKIGGKLRLTLPLLYLLIAVISTFFTDWTTKNEKYVLLGLYILIGLVVLSWFISLIKAIRNKRQERFWEDDMAWQITTARQRGIINQGDIVRFNDRGDLLDPSTNQPIMF
ncbi:putative membrane chloride channel (bestrophin family) [Lachnospiraceae bacterium PF1-21]